MHVRCGDGGAVADGLGGVLVWVAGALDDVVGAVDVAHGVGDVVVFDDAVSVGDCLRAPRWSGRRCATPWLGRGRRSSRRRRRGRGSARGRPGEGGGARRVPRGRAGERESGPRGRAGWWRESRARRVVSASRVARRAWTRLARRRSDTRSSPGAFVRGDARARYAVDTAAGPRSWLSEVTRIDSLENNNATRTAPGTKSPRNRARHVAARGVRVDGTVRTSPRASPRAPNPRASRSRVPHHVVSAMADPDHRPCTAPSASISEIRTRSWPSRPVPSVPRAGRSCSSPA